MIDQNAGFETKSDPFKHLDEQQFERLFEDRSRHEELRRYFGDEAYEDIIALRRHAKRRGASHEELVLLLPGIMGSELTVVSTAGSEDHIWLDYWDILTGDLFRLKLGAGETVKATGALRRYYYKLKVQMESLGYDAKFFPFDWRLSIRDSGRALAEYIEQTSRPVHIIGHSMGGLVARAAAIPGTAASALIKKVVMLGTPNYGSFSPVLAFRGSHDIARKIAFLDIHHSNDEYRSELFMGFPGLYEMLPDAGKLSIADLFDLANWPTDQFTLNTNYLARARELQQTLFPGDDRFFLIAGVNNETIISARPDVENRQFVYEKSFEGDGTVPLACCLLPSAKTYYCETEHGALPNDKTVGYAAYDLLRDGATTSLEQSWTPKRARLRTERTVTDRDLYQQPLNIDRQAPTDKQMRDLLSGFVSVKTDRSFQPVLEVPVATGGYNKRRQIEIRVAQGNLVNVESPAYVLALYSDKTPTVAARVVDRAMGGSLIEQIIRGEVDGAQGHISFVPTINTKLFTDHIVFVGLGAIDDFRAWHLRDAGQAIAKAFAEKRIPEIVTLPIGLGTGLHAEDVIQEFAGGLLAGVLEHDTDQVIKRITFCDLDTNNCKALSRELHLQAEYGLFGRFDVQHGTSVVPAAEKTEIPLETSYPLRLTIRMGDRLEKSAKSIVVNASLSVPEARQGDIATGRMEVDLVELRRIIAELGNRHRISHEFGVGLSKLLLDQTVIDGLEEALRYEDRALVLAHDKAASIVPWETLSFAWRRQPSTNISMSREYLAPDIQFNKSLAKRKTSSELSVLLVIDPTSDLVGARQEGARIQRVLNSSSHRLQMERLYQREATKEQILAELRSGQYDVVHYAGHAFFDPDNPRRSGLICADEVPLVGEEIGDIDEFPTLIFFNACEAARVRRGRDGKAEVKATIENQVERNIGLAEAFLRAGAIHYLGTYWPVDDTAAKIFATEFYERFVSGAPIGEAIYRARQDVHRSNGRDWADYIHYGKSDFRLTPPST